MSIDIKHHRRHSFGVFRESRYIVDITPILVSTHRTTAHCTASMKITARIVAGLLIAPAVAVAVAGELKTPEMTFPSLSIYAN